jgi:hypothetical protein
MFHLAPSTTVIQRRRRRQQEEEKEEEEEEEEERRRRSHVEREGGCGEPKMEQRNTAKIRSLSATVSVSIVNRFEFGIYENIFEDP